LDERGQEFGAGKVDHSFGGRGALGAVFRETDFGGRRGEFQEGTMGEWGESMESARDSLFAGVAPAS